MAGSPRPGWLQAAPAAAPLALPSALSVWPLAVRSRSGFLRIRVGVVLGTLGLATGAAAWPLVAAAQGQRYAASRGTAAGSGVFLIDNRLPRGQRGGRRRRVGAVMIGMQGRGRMQRRRDGQGSRSSVACGLPGPGSARASGSFRPGRRSARISEARCRLTAAPSAALWARSCCSFSGI